MFDCVLKWVHSRLKTRDLVINNPFADKRDQGKPWPQTGMDANRLRFSHFRCPPRGEDAEFDCVAVVRNRDIPEPDNRLPKPIYSVSPNRVFSTFR